MQITRDLPASNPSDAASIIEASSAAWEDHSMNASGLVGIAIGMCILLLGIVGMLVLLYRRCLRPRGISLWPGWCCTCHPAHSKHDEEDAEDAPPSYGMAVIQHGLPGGDIVQPPEKAHMSMSSTTLASDSDSNSNRRASSL